MAETPKSEWTSTDKQIADDPDMPTDVDENPQSVLAADHDTPVGETDRIAEEKAAYRAAAGGDHSDHGHAVGGSEGTADGQ